MIRLYEFHDDYKGRLAVFEKRIYPLLWMTMWITDEKFSSVTAKTRNAGVFSVTVHCGGCCPLLILSFITQTVES